MARDPQSEPNPDAPDLGASSREGYFELSRAPWHSLLFVLPIVVLFDLGSVRYLAEQDITVSAFRLIGRFYSALGAYGIHLPALALVAVLLTQHIMSNASWRVRWAVLPAMLIESAIWTAPLLVLALMLGPESAVSLSQAQPQPVSIHELPWQVRMTVALGAGLYEELLFRMMLIALVHLVATDLLKLNSALGATLALVVSALAFAFYHDVWTDGSLDLTRVSFFALSGLFFGGVYLARGFGIVVGLHAMYDVLALLVIGRV